MCINLGNNIKLSMNSNTRGNMNKMYKRNFRLDSKKYFCNKITNVWNYVLNSVVCCTSLSFCKYRLKEVNFQPFLKEYADI